MYMEVGPHHSSSQEREQKSYRQVTCIVCKIAEALVRILAVDFWSDLNLFNPDQFAYLRGKSTLAQLLSNCYNDWAKAKVSFAANGYHLLRSL